MYYTFSAGDFKPNPINPSVTSSIYIPANNTDSALFNLTTFPPIIIHGGTLVALQVQMPSTNSDSCAVTCSIY